MGDARAHWTHWSSFVRSSPLALLLDLDGTLLSFSRTPDETRVDDELRWLLSRLTCLPDVFVALVSGRPQPWMAAHFEDTRGLWLMAEHGAWRRGDGAWERTLAVESTPLDELAAVLDEVASRHAGAVVERKASSLAFHFRAVASAERVAPIVEVGALLLEFLDRHPSFEQLLGDGVIEVRPSGVRKSLVVPWMRGRASGDARLLAIGDDLTDEQMFAALGPLDEAIRVGGRDVQRPTHARWYLEQPSHVRELLHWVADVRVGLGARPVVLPFAIPTEQATEHPATDLIVISNRLPELRGAEAPDDAESTRRRPNGGLVAALQPALERRKGIWLGWSGRTIPDEGAAKQLGFDRRAAPPMAWIDLPERWYRDYYAGFCNRTLWPLFHSFPERARFRDAEWAAYVEVNDAFADAALGLVPRGLVWVHDYHLLLLGRSLRRRGHSGPLGLFLHIPFPSPDLLALLPWARELLAAICDFDLVACHTVAHAANFVHCAKWILGATTVGDTLVYDGREVAIRALPLGIVGDAWCSDDRLPDRELAPLHGNLAGRKLVLGVDRLDYTKGIPERLLAFGRLLERAPEWRDKVSLVQVSVPSRADVPDYAEQRARIERVVGRINGEFGEAHWVPIRYLYRSYDTHQLAELYRLADVGYVTPLRDGMNLVAKEFVAAQRPDDPGVLLLSRFAGAAEELDAALLTNPWHVDGMARDLQEALSMPLAERRERHARLLTAVQRTSAAVWAETFLAELEGTRG